MTGVFTRKIFPLLQQHRIKAAGTVHSPSLQWNIYIVIAEWMYTVRGEKQRLGGGAHDLSVIFFEKPMCMSMGDQG